ncbi:hypothetical protein CTI14_01650 [Methylobacterium radiotolerans]|nr:hypothetical protein CTI14_01650 [Methylobacterium radiotolerans]
MAPDERRYTAEEWREIQSEYREQPRRAMRSMFPDPVEECELGPFVPEPAYAHARGRSESPPRHHPHVESWFSTLSQEDITKLEVLISLRPETVKWVAEKNSRELERLDGAVEFISSSRTAAKVLMWVCGVAVTCVTGSIALAKAGYDAFALFRGIGR